MLLEQPVSQESLVTLDRQEPRVLLDYPARQEPRATPVTPALRDLRDPKDCQAPLAKTLHRPRLPWRQTSPERPQEIRWLSGAQDSLRVSLSPSY